MALTPKDVYQVAKLARLSLSEEQREKLLEDLGSILSYIQKLRQLDIKDVQPTSHAVPKVNAWREDVVHPFPNPESIVEGAPDSERGFFRVKKVIDS